MTNLKFNLIAACDSKMGIGRNNQLPWKLRNEMAYFNRMTTGVDKPPCEKRNVVVMGRKTWDSIPPKFRPLKGRLNVVLSRNKPEETPTTDVIWTSSWEEMKIKLSTLQQNGEIGKIWITGGNYVYKLALESIHCHRIYLTKIQHDYGCDVRFPEFNEKDFQLVKDSDVPEGPQQEDGVNYEFFVYEKKGL